MKLSEIAQLLNVAWNGLDVEIKGFSQDTRKIKLGELFIALRGPNFDGHEYLNDAASQGAVAALIDEEISTTLPSIRVPDVKKALYELAHAYRLQQKCKVIAVTGSCGKTTTKTLLANVFAEQANTLSNESSFNNDIGVPLTLLRLTNVHQYAITELGANHPGEIAHLTHLVEPDVALITNAGPSHLEGFGDLNGVACAKGEIFQGLKQDGVAVINNDDQFHAFWKKLAGQNKIITFGVENPADVMATEIKSAPDMTVSFTLVLPTDQIRVNLNIIGEHNIRNAVAASAAAYTLGINIKKIKAGLENAQAVSSRLNVKKGLRGSVIIDDTYNANPSSVVAAMQVLLRSQGETVLVLGDMLELGENSEAMHRELGVQAEKLGVKQLYCYGLLTQHTAKAFGTKAVYFNDKNALIETLKNKLTSDMTVLVKGSNSMGMDEVVTAIME